MLSPADARVVQRDPHLPDLGTLLDGDAFAGMLRRLCPGREVVRARPLYLRYKPGTSCLVAYEVHLPGGVTRAYARCHRDDEPSKVDNAVQRLDVPGPLGFGLLADPATAIAIFEFPNDYELRTLRKLFEPEKYAQRVRRILPGHRHLRESQPELLRYKPERRFVGKMSADEGPPAVVRLYRAAGFGPAREKAWAFHDQGTLQVPRVVGDSVRYAALAQEWIDGEPLIRSLRDPSAAIEAAERVGTALVDLHQQRPRLSQLHAADDYCRIVQSACAAVGACDPALGARAAAVFDQVQLPIMNRRWRSQAVHGDFTADQVLLAGDRVAILDYDHAGYGDPCMDLGAFAAGLVALSLDGRTDARVAEECASAFATAYWRAAGQAEPADARLFTSAALLLMAPEPFRFRHENWHEQTALILDHAERTMASAAVGS